MRDVLPVGTPVAQPWEEAESSLRRIVGTQVDADELNLVLQPYEPRGSGYVLGTLWTVRFAFDTTNRYESCVRHAIAFGHDTDTTACVAGGIAGYAVSRAFHRAGSPPCVAWSWSRRCWKN